jgi:DNA polymerase III subunit delta'
MTELSAQFAAPYPWQQSEWQRILQQHAGQLAHALMLAGPKGLGKFQFAKSLAHYVLCLSPQSALPCGNCRCCALTKAETHPDLHWVLPDEPGKAIKVDQIRQLTEFVGKTSQQNGMKVAVISPAEAMNLNAANALLKCLEEPAGATLLLLVSHTPSAVMATIRSRCQLLNFPVPNTEQTIPWLQPLIGNEDASTLLSFTRGAPLSALGLVDGDALEQRKNILNDLIALAERRSSVLDVAKRWMDYDPLAVLEWILIWLHKATSGQFSGENIAKSVELDGVFQHLHGPFVFRYFDKVIQFKRQLLSGANPNKQLLLEELLMDWSALTNAGKMSARPVKVSI